MIKNQLTLSRTRTHLDERTVLSVGDLAIVFQVTSDQPYCSYTVT